MLFKSSEDCSFDAIKYYLDMAYKEGKDYGFMLGMAVGAASVSAIILFLLLLC